MSSAEIVTGLKAALKADRPSRAKVYGLKESGFQRGIIIFNGAVKSPSLALVQPRNARDVSRVVKYCTQNGLELSVKGGGYGTHGWSVAGHVVLDLSLMDEVSIALPSTSPSLFDSFNVTIGDSAHASEITVAEPDLIDGAEDASPQPEMTRFGSSDTAKRGVPDGFGTVGGSRGRRRLDDLADDDFEMVDGPAGSNVVRPHSGSKNSLDAGHSGTGSTSEASGSMRRTDSNSATGSSSRSGTGSGHGTPNNSTSTPSNSTAATSISDGVFRIPYPTSLDIGDSGMGVSGINPVASSSTLTTSSATGSGEISSSGPRTRVTYVNPSPTLANSSPLALYGTAGGSFQDGRFNTPRLVLNTNPDPPAHTLVSFGAGAHSKTLDRITAGSPYGAFHIPSSAFPVGSGQFLTGGFGFLGRRYGLAMDNIVEAEMVLADGRIVWVGQNGNHHGDWKEGENPEDVWWAVRGAGSILGVVTRLRARAYYVPSVYAGNFIYVFDPITTPQLLRHVRDCIKGSPRTLYVNIIMTAGPAGAPAIVVIQICHSGNRAEGELYVSALGSWSDGKVLFQDFSERTFERQQLAVEDVLRGGMGRKWFIKSDMLLSLTDDVIDETCKRFHSVPDGCTWLFEFTGGSVMEDIQDSSFPPSHRRANFTVAALHQWNHDESVAEDERCIQTANEWINEVIHPNSPGGPLPCFLQSSLRDDVSATFGENFARLERLKRLFDPTNFFKHSMWPRSMDESTTSPAVTDGEIEGREGDIGKEGGGQDGDDNVSVIGERRAGRGDDEVGPDQWKQIGEDEVKGPTLAELAAEIFNAEEPKR